MTPGPWELESKSNLDGSDVLVQDPSGAYVIADCWTAWQRNGLAPPLEDARANARLIAAAPDLLAALKELVAYMDDHDGYPAIELPCIQDARRAIAKAEGR